MLDTKSSRAQPHAQHGVSFAFRGLATSGKAHHGGNHTSGGLSVFGLNGLEISFDRRRLDSRLDGDVFGRFDAEADAVAADLKNRDLDFVRNDDFLVSFTTNDEHLATSPFYTLKLKNVE